MTIDAPRERIFEFVGDLANRPSFTDHFISDFHLSREDASGVGAGARYRSRVPPQAIWMDTRIEELDPPRRIVERGRGGRLNRIPTATMWELVEGPGSLTTVRVIFWTEAASPLDRAKDLLGGASIWYQRDWAAALRRLRELLESGSDQPRRVAIAGGDRRATSEYTLAADA